MDIRKDLKELGWNLYKNNKIEIIYEKHNRETLIVFNKDGKTVSFKNVHSLNCEELEAIRMEMNNLILNTYFEKKIKY
ncbi:hypothetical protein [Parvimonas sp. G1967]|uniref:hypothetical protein n=1 Tax=Parvimonas sp. G1967 TaxID=3387695 RepID=UPI0039E312CE